MSEIRRVEIIAIDTTGLKAQVRDGSGTVFWVDLSYAPSGVFVTPSVGETWIVERKGIGGLGTWVLDKKVSNGLQLAEGDARLDIDGTFHILAEELRLNGVDIGDVSNDSGGSNILYGGECDTDSYWSQTVTGSATIQVGNPAFPGYQSRSCIVGRVSVPGDTAVACHRILHKCYAGEPYTLSFYVSPIMKSIAINNVTPDDLPALGVKFFDTDGDPVLDGMGNPYEIWQTLKTEGAWERVSFTYTVPNDVSIRKMQVCVRIGLVNLRVLDTTAVDPSEWNKAGGEFITVEAISSGSYLVDIDEQPGWQIQQGSTSDFFFANATGIFRSQNGVITNITGPIDSTGWSIRLSGGLAFATTQQPPTGQFRVRNVNKLTISRYPNYMYLDKGQLETGTSMSGWTFPGIPASILATSIGGPTEGQETLINLYDNNDTTYCSWPTGVASSRLIEYIYPQPTLIGRFVGRFLDVSTMAPLTGFQVFLQLSDDNEIFTYFYDNTGAPGETSDVAVATASPFASDSNGEIDIALPVVREYKFCRVVFVSTGPVAVSTCRFLDLVIAGEVIADYVRVNGGVSPSELIFGTVPAYTYFLSLSGGDSGKTVTVADKLNLNKRLEEAVVMDTRMKLHPYYSSTEGTLVAARGSYESALTQFLSLGYLWAESSGNSLSSDTELVDSSQLDNINSISSNYYDQREFFTGLLAQFFQNSTKSVSIDADGIKIGIKNSSGVYEAYNSELTSTALNFKYADETRVSIGTDQTTIVNTNLVGDTSIGGELSTPGTFTIGDLLLVQMISNGFNINFQ